MPCPGSRQATGHTGAARISSADTQSGFRCSCSAGQDTALTPGLGDALGQR